MPYINPASLLAPYLQPLSHTAVQVFPALLNREAQKQQLGQHITEWAEQKPFREAQTEVAQETANKAREANRLYAQYFGAGGSTEGRSPEELAKDPYKRAAFKYATGMELPGPTRSFHEGKIVELDAYGRPQSVTQLPGFIPSRTDEQLIAMSRQVDGSGQPTAEAREASAILTTKQERANETARLNRMNIVNNPMPSQPENAQYVGMTEDGKPISYHPRTQTMTVEGQPYMGPVGKKTTPSSVRPILKGIVPEGVEGFTPGATVLFDPSKPGTFFAEGKPYTGTVGSVSQERPYFTAIGTDPTTGNVITFDTRTNQVFDIPTPAGGISPLKLTEDWKQDLMAIRQSSDLIGSLKANWNKMGITDRGSAVIAFGEAKTGFNSDAKLYNDDREAFLGQVSRSIAAERGVLTNQDIDRISKALPRIGVNPLNVDNQDEAAKKWNQIEAIIKMAENRMAERRNMTYANTGGINPTGQPKTDQPKPSWKDVPSGGSSTSIKYDAQGNRIQ